MFCETYRKTAQSPISLTFNCIRAYSLILQWFKNKSQCLKAREYVSDGQGTIKKASHTLSYRCEFFTIIYVLFLIIQRQSSVGKLFKMSYLQPITRIAIIIKLTNIYYDLCSFKLSSWIMIKIVIADIIVNFIQILTEFKFLMFTIL